MFEFQNLWANRSLVDGDVIEPPDWKEVSRDALEYEARLERRNERLETISKANSILDRYIRSQLNINDDEDREELAGLRSVKARLAKAAGQSGRSFAKLSGRVYGKPQGAGAYWQTQRDIADPSDEAEEGVDLEENEGDDIDTDEFLKTLDKDTNSGCDQNGAHLNAIGYHLAKIKMAHEMGDHETCRKSTNAAMRHFKAFHGAMKDAMED